MRNRTVLFSFLLNVWISFFYFTYGFIGNTEASSLWPYKDETPQQRTARLAWWKQARFGMFITWGVYSVPAGIHNGKEVDGEAEWIMDWEDIPIAEYKKYAEQFNPVKYNPDEWVQLAKEAGMKYIVITAKHHDGFALFDSKVTDWDVVDATPYGKDLLKPLAEACQRHGIKLGFYYSQAQDWCHPGGAARSGHWDDAQKGDMDEYIQNIAVPQVKEILTNYGDISILWWDTSTNMKPERAEKFQPLINLSPGIITNDRLGGDCPGDFTTPEQHIPITGLDTDWEVCMTMNKTWGFGSNDHNWKSAETLIRYLVNIVSMGGNYLLNVGPTADGLIPEPSVERLKAIGQWMKINGDSIYETTASPFNRLAWGHWTKKEFINGATLYLHVFDWPTDGKLYLPGLKNPVQQAYLMADLEKLQTNATAAGVTVHLPEQAPDEIDSVVVLKVSGPLDVEKILPTQDNKGEVLLKAEQVEVHNPKYIELQRIRGGQNIGRWVNTSEWIEWVFVTHQKQKFMIDAEIALGEDSTFELIIDGQPIQVTTKATGGFETFQEVTLGQTDLLSSGKHYIQIKPIKEQWKPINIRTITLKPIK